MQKIIVISGVNLTEGGPLSVMKDAIRALIEAGYNTERIILLVNSKKLFQEFADAFEICEYRYPKKSWLLRLWFEYIHSYFISRKMNVYLWFSIHDVTANVKAIKRAVYCQNPAPFYKLSRREAFLEPSLFFFRYLYLFFYGFNIRANNYVVVQQDWFRNEFHKRFKLSNIIVAHPSVALSSEKSNCVKIKSVKVFFYPALPRVFKNFEVLFEAAQILNHDSLAFEIIVTIKGDENQYASTLFNKYKHIKQIKFLGAQTRENIWKLYQQSECLIFPSKMETWGLPITEFKTFKKPIIAANLPYAIETIGNYDKVKLFEPSNTEQLYRIMKSIITEENIEFDKTNYKAPDEPFASTWSDLFKLILN